MGIKERKERDKARIKQLIINAALDLFTEFGYEKTSIRRIAKEIDYSPATIYLYFKDKDQIFFYLHTKMFTLLKDQLMVVFDSEDPIERIRLCGTVYLKFAFDHPEWYDLMFILKAPMNALNKQEDWVGGLKIFELLKGTIREAIESGMMKSSDLDLRAATIWGHLHGIASLYLRGRFRMIDPELLEELLFSSVNDMIDCYTI